jgi:molybdate transport system substrate-binding protein
MIPGTTRAPVVAALLAVALAGCGSGSSGTATPRLTGSITVFAAASLTGSFSALGRAFEAAHPGTTVTFSFGPSSGLATQVLAGAPADVFASASPKNMEQVTDGGAATGAVVFAKNVAEIAAAPGSTIAALSDLAGPGVKVALCQPQVPCGALATKVLANAKVTVKPVTQGLDVKSTLAYVTNGSADAAIVYVTDVKAAGNKVKGVQIPAAVNAGTAYEIAPIKASKQAALAQAFEDYVLSADGQSALQAAGLQKP